MTQVNSNLAAMTRRTKPLGFAALAFSLAITGKARAEPSFPETIQAHLNLNYTPSCTFCHATPQGGGLVVTLFGQSMLKAGLTTDVSTVDPALDKLDADHTDSDGNGTPDIQQIEEGFDPSTGVKNGPTERYGCGAHLSVSPVRLRDSFTIALCAAGLVVFARRRASRR